MKFEKITNSVIEETFYKGTHESGLTVYVLKKENYSKYYAKSKEKEHYSICSMKPELQLYSNHTKTQ